MLVTKVPLEGKRKVIGVRKINKEQRGEAAVATRQHRKQDRRTRKEKAQDEAERAVRREEERVFNAPSDYAPGEAASLNIIRESPGATKAAIREANEANIRAAVPIILSGRSSRDMERMAQTLYDINHEHKDLLPLIEEVARLEIKAARAKEDAMAARIAKDFNPAKRLVAKLLVRGLEDKVIKSSLYDKLLAELRVSDVKDAVTREQWLAERGITPITGGSMALASSRSELEINNDKREYLRKWTAVRNHAREAGARLVDTVRATLPFPPAALIARSTRTADVVMSQAQARIERLKVAVKWSDLTAWQKSRMRSKPRPRAVSTTEVEAPPLPERQPAIVGVSSSSAPADDWTSGEIVSEDVLIALPPPKKWMQTNLPSSVAVAFAGLDARARVMRLRDAAKERLRQARHAAKAARQEVRDHVRWVQAIMSEEQLVLSSRPYEVSSASFIGQGVRLTHATAIASMGANGEITMSDDVPKPPSKLTKQARAPKHERAAPAAAAVAAAVADLRDREAAARDAVREAEGIIEEQAQEERRLPTIELPDYPDAPGAIAEAHEHARPPMVRQAVNMRRDALQVPVYYARGVDEFAIVMRPEEDETVNWAALDDRKHNAINVLDWLTAVLSILASLEAFIIAPMNAAVGYARDAENGRPFLQRRNKLAWVVSWLAPLLYAVYYVIMLLRWSLTPVAFAMSTLATSLRCILDLPYNTRYVIGRLFGRGVLGKPIASKYTFKAEALSKDDKLDDKRCYQMRQDELRYGAQYYVLRVERRTLWQWALGSYVTITYEVTTFELGTVTSVLTPPHATTVIDFRQQVNRTVLAAQMFRAANVDAVMRATLAKGSTYYVIAMLASQLMGSALN